MSSLSECLENIGRPVAYYPRIARALGGVKQGIFFCQLFFLDGKQHDEDGWIYKTAEEIREETGLSYKEQLTAREYLKRLGVIEERYARLDHKMFFRINLEALDATWNAWQQQKEQEIGEISPSSQREVREHPEGLTANAPTGDSIYRTKTTTETTTENILPQSQTKPDSASPQWPQDGLFVKDFLDQEPYLRPHYSEKILATLNNPRWWEDVAESINGLSTEFLNQEFAKMGAWLTENPHRKPTTKLKTFIRGWLQRAYERQRKQPWLSEKQQQKRYAAR